MNVFTQRVFSSAGLICLCCLGLFFKPLFDVIVLAVTGLGLYEFFGMLERKGIVLYKYFGIAMGLLIPASIMFQFELTKGWELLFIVCALLVLIVMQFRRSQSAGVVVGISTTIFGILYVGWFFSYLVRIRQMNDGIALVAALLLITKAGDIGAYLIGSRWGRHKLMPQVSPHKTVEGSLGGLVCSVAAGYLCLFFLPAGMFSPRQMFVLGLSLGVLAQMGDLSESLMKRDCGIKDSASLVPGMGGVLDIIDSLLFTAPVFYFYVTLKLFILSF